MANEQAIKEAFSRIKQDIDSLKEEIKDLKEKLDDLYSLNNHTEIIEDLQEDIVRKEKAIKEVIEETNPNNNSNNIIQEIDISDSYY